MRLTKDQRLGTKQMWEWIKIHINNNKAEFFTPLDTANAVVYNQNAEFVSKHVLWDIPYYVIPIDHKQKMYQYINEEVAMEMEGDITEKKCLIKNMYALIEMHIQSLKGMIEYNLKHNMVLTYNKVGDFCGMFPNDELKYLYYAVPMGTKEEMLKYCDIKMELIDQRKPIV
jgi:hypothetical protein